MEPEYCHCGQPLHYSNPEMERIMRRLETMRKQYGDEVSQYTFYQHGGAIFMVKQEETPVLVTILSEDMLEGTVIRKANPEEMNQIFARWRFEDRQRRYDG